MSPVADAMGLIESQTFGCRAAQENAKVGNAKPFGAKRKKPIGRRVAGLAWWVSRLYAGLRAVELDGLGIGSVFTL